MSLITLKAILHYEVNTDGLVSMQKPVSESLAFIMLLVPLLPCDLSNLPNPMSPFKPTHVFKGTV